MLILFLLLLSGTNTARALSILPPNILTPAAYTALVRQICQSYNDHHNQMQQQHLNELEYTEWTPQQLQELGCGAFLAVTQANGPISERTDRLVRIKYTPPRPVAAVASSTSSLSTSISSSSSASLVEEDRLGASKGKAKKEFSFWRDQVEVALADAEKMNTSSQSSNSVETKSDSSSSSS